MKYMGFFCVKKLSKYIKLMAAIQFVYFVYYSSSSYCIHAYLFSYTTLYGPKHTLTPLSNHLYSN